MVALLIDGLRYAARAPRRSRAPAETPGNYAGALRCAGRRSWTAARREGVEALTPGTRPDEGHDITDHWGPDHPTAPRTPSATARRRTRSRPAGCARASRRGAGAGRPALRSQAGFAGRG